MKRPGRDKYLPIVQTFNSHGGAVPVLQIRIGSFFRIHSQQEIDRQHRCSPSRLKLRHYFRGSADVPCPVNLTVSFLDINLADIQRFNLYFVRHAGQMPQYNLQSSRDQISFLSYRYWSIYAWIRPHRSWQATDWLRPYAQIGFCS